MTIHKEDLDDEDTLPTPEVRAALRARQEQEGQDDDGEYDDGDDAGEEEDDDTGDGEDDGEQQDTPPPADDDDMPWFVTLVKWLVAAPICLLLAYLGLVFNEQESATRRNALNRLAQETTELQDISTVNPALNGRSVYIHGTPQTDKVLTDPEFGIRVPTVKLCRNVEYYQWTETRHTSKKKDEDGREYTTTYYTHSKEWVSHPVNSRLFKESSRSYTNTCACRKDAISGVAADAHLGAFPLDKAWLEDIPCTANVDPATVKLPEDIRPRCLAHDKYIYVGTAPPKPRQPRVGDVRIWWSYVPQDASMGIIAQQDDTNLVPIPCPDLEEDVFKVSFPGDDKVKMLGEYTLSRWELWVYRLLGALALIPVLAWVPGVGRLIPRMGNWSTACVLACAVSGICLLLFETDRPADAAIDSAAFFLAALLLWRKLRSPF